MTIPTELAPLENTRLSLREISIAAGVPVDTLNDIMDRMDRSIVSDQAWNRVLAAVNKKQMQRSHKKQAKKYRDRETRTEAVTRCLSESHCCLSAKDIRRQLGIPLDTVNYVLREQLGKQGRLQKQVCNCRRNSPAKISKHDPKRPVSCYRLVKS